MNYGFVKVLPVIILVGAIVGCSGDGTAGRKPTHAVQGTVTLAGAPVANATVMFTPAGSDQRVATGQTDDNGKYTLTTYDTGDGAIVGEYRVLVIRSAKKADTGKAVTDHDAFQKARASGSDPTATGSHDAAESSAGSVSSLPGKYADVDSTDLTGIVEAGKENVIDLKLEL